MSKAILAVYNSSSDYISHFLAFFRNHNYMFEAIGFTNLQAVTDYLKAGRIDILLLSREAIKKYINIANISKKEDILSVLGNNSENISEIIFLGEQQDLSSFPKEIDMYRSMDKICGDLEKIALSLHLSYSEDTAALNIYGIYKLDGNDNTNNFALSLAKKLSPYGSDVLFMDLDRFSELNLQYGLSQRYTLTDLIYQFLIESDSFGETLIQSLSHINSVPTLAAPVSMDDLDELNNALWKQFLLEITKHGHFSAIVMKITDSCKDLINLFGICREIYLFTSDFASASSGAESDNFRALTFFNYFKDRAQTDTLSKMFDGHSSFAEITDTEVYTPSHDEKPRSHGKK